MELLMYQIHFDHPVHVHFIGIGGISMSGLASVLLKEGFTVSGSDAKASPLTEQLSAQGARIMIGQCAENIDPACSVVVYTAAIHPDNPEFAQAVSLNIPMLTRAQLLGQIMKNYEMPIAVAGTHGKTTTTSMLSHVTMQAGMDPTISVGGILKSIGGNIRVGNSGTFITEACEYTNSFLSFYPKMELILNIDADHLDFFKDLAQIRSSFHSFALLMDGDGTLIINGEIPDLASFTSDLPCKVITYGSTGSDYTAGNIRFDEAGFSSFDVYCRGSHLGSLKLQVPGLHNVSNALACTAAARELGVSFADIQKGLYSFTGTDRRFEHKGTWHGVTVIDDYAHHPTEISATLQAAKKTQHSRIVCVFQPHTYTRTSALLPDFARALSHADVTILADIYAAREKNTIGITSDDLRREMQQLGANALYFPSFDEILTYLTGHLKEGDLLITMGAGDIVTVGERLLSSEPDPAA